MLKQFLQKFINRGLWQVRTLDGSSYVNFLVTDVTDEYLYGFCQEEDLWVLIPLSSIVSVLMDKTLQEMEA